MHIVLLSIDEFISIEPWKTVTIFNYCLDSCLSVNYEKNLVFPKHKKSLDDRFSYDAVDQEYKYLVKVFKLIVTEHCTLSGLSLGICKFQMQILDYFFLGYLL